jgi:hypothetical protein
MERPNFAGELAEAIRFVPYDLAGPACADRLQVAGGDSSEAMLDEALDRTLSIAPWRGSSS